MPGPVLVTLFVAIALLALIPTRRLYVAGWRGLTVWLYFGFIVAVGLLIAELRAPARFLVPILVVAYLAPFVAARAGVARLLGRSDGGTLDPPATPPKDVTPPDDDGG